MVWAALATWRSCCAELDRVALDDQIVQGAIAAHTVPVRINISGSRLGADR